MTSPAPSRLAFDRVTVASPGAYDTAVWDISLALAAGELAVVLVDRSHPVTPLADLSCGLVRPDRGNVRHNGVDWSAMSTERVASARGRIGRYFERAPWLSNLPLDENVTLAALHHTEREERDIYDEAADLAREFDLPGLPRGPVWRAHPIDLRRAACVRAFLGEPDLILLERPTLGAFAEVMAPLINVTRQARRRGAAVLWLTSDHAVFESRGLRPDHRFRLVGTRLRTAPSEDRKPWPAR